MLVCDRAIREEGTRKISLIGIFEQIRASTFPALHFELGIYVKLSDCEGQYRLRLDLFQLEDDTVLNSAEATINPNDRMSAVEIVFALHHLVFPKAGIYEFRLHANNRFVGSKTVRVIEWRPPVGGASHDS